LQGAFSKEINNIADKIIYLRMYVEAALDFPEEEIDFISDAQVVQPLQDLLALLTAILAKASQGAIVREGIQLVIIGKPNVGKSTLINQLSGEETAIVTPIAGTTRDILKERILINDVPVSIIDTAGLRDSDDVVEQEGVRRAKLATNTADLVMLVADINSHDQQDLEALKIEHDIRQPVLHVFNKIDMQQQMNENEESTVYISAKEGQGIDALKQQILAKIGLANKEIESGYSARRRHLNALEQSLSSVQTGYDNLTQHNAGELLAEDLKLAHRALGEITGEFSADDLLGKIFSSFCIGK
jgi:tRNA modification GTPase